jgi:hypothetical protein
LAGAGKTIDMALAIERAEMARVDFFMIVICWNL